MLAAVDHIFSDAGKRAGPECRSASLSCTVSSRIGHAGAVDLWEMIAPEAGAEGRGLDSAFRRDAGKRPGCHPRRRASPTSIGDSVGRETIVEKGKERLIEAGDILVLVRKRDAFVNALTRR